MSNQRTTQRGPARQGGLGLGHEPPELGTVVSVQPATYTYSVRTLSGRPHHGVPRKRYASPDLSLLAVGTSVIVRYDVGFPYIDGVLDMPSTPSTGTGIQVSEAGSLPTASEAPGIGGYRAPHEPNDLLGGDTLVGNAQGARVGILSGGVALLKASGMAQVRAHALNDLLEIMSRNYRHVTDMGFTEIRNDQGRVSMKFRGASDQTNEAGSSEENWTIRMDLGASGDLFNFELTTPQGQTLFKLHVDSNGRCHLFGADGVVIQSGAANGEEHVTEQGGDARDVVHGARTVITDLDASSTVKGNHADVVDGNRTTSVGVDSATSVGRDAGYSVGRNASVVIAGQDATTPALRAEIRNGDLELALGQVSAPKSAVKITTVQGDLIYSSTLGGNFKVDSKKGEARIDVRKAVINTTTPDSVILAGQTLAAHLARFEEFETLFKTFLRQYDSHIHPIPGFPSTSAPLISLSGILAGLIARVKSVRVGVGG